MNKLEGVHPELAKRVTALIGIAKQDGYDLTVTQGLRTFAEQDKLFNQWRDGKDNDGDKRIDESDERVTHAAGGQSNHNYGLAVDLVFLINGIVSWNDLLYVKIGEWAKECDLAWGGNWKHKDLPHVEMPNLPNWRVLLSVYKKANGNLQVVWDSVT